MAGGANLFVNSFIGTLASSVAAFVLWSQGVFAIDWLSAPEILTLWPFTEISYSPLVWSVGMSV